MDLEEVFGPVIGRYTRAQAITDGVLVDVTTTARQAGFGIPVALTAAATAEAVTWDRAHGAHQDPAGRLWDVLTVAYLTAAANPRRQRVGFSVLRVPNTSGAEVAQLVALEMQIGPGDDPAGPVITILLPGQD